MHHWGDDQGRTLSGNSSTVGERCQHMREAAHMTPIRTCPHPDPFQPPITPFFRISDSISRKSDSSVFQFSQKFLGLPYIRVKCTRMMTVNRGMPGADRPKNRISGFFRKIAEIHPAKKGPYSRSVGRKGGPIRCWTLQREAGSDPDRYFHVGDVFWEGCQTR
jgi:hypothetical protein